MNTRSKSSLFLIEILAVILLFALSAGVCLRLFFQSRQISRESINLSRASLEVQSAADCYKALDGDIDGAAEILGGVVSDGALSVYYDGEWVQTEGADGASYCVTVMELAPKEGIVTAEDLSGGWIFTVNVRGGLDLE